MMAFHKLYFTCLDKNCSFGAKVSFVPLTTAAVLKTLALLVLICYRPAYIKISCARVLI